MSIVKKVFPKSVRSVENNVKFLSKMPVKEINRLLPNAVGENAVVKNVVEENAVGENAVGENAVGENAVGELSKYWHGNIKVENVKSYTVTCGHDIWFTENNSNGKTNINLFDVLNNNYGIPLELVKVNVLSKIDDSKDSKVQIITIDHPVVSAGKTNYSKEIPIVWSVCNIACNATVTPNVSNATVTPNTTLQHVLDKTTDVYKDMRDKHGVDFDNIIMLTARNKTFFIKTLDRLIEYKFILNLYAN